MKRLFTEILKLALFIGLILGAAYLTGNWDALIRLIKEAQLQIGNLTNQVVSTIKSVL
ncbi:MAG: hypothetical protein LBJ96_05740 [Holosporaceae bacterium]|jgi:hypothetical protein|nr:hypothetical protein [Holosporaceae bacterium]